MVSPGGPSVRRPPTGRRHRAPQPPAGTDTGPANPLHLLTDNATEDVHRRRDDRACEVGWGPRPMLGVLCQGASDASQVEAWWPPAGPPRAKPRSISITRPATHLSFGSGCHGGWHPRQGLAWSWLPTWFRSGSRRMGGCPRSAFCKPLINFARVNMEIHRNTCDYVVCVSFCPDGGPRGKRGTAGAQGLPRSAPAPAPHDSAVGSRRHAASRHVVLLTRNLHHKSSQTNRSVIQKLAGLLAVICSTVARDCISRPDRHGRGRTGPHSSSLALRVHVSLQPLPHHVLELHGI